jgi:hypothetical protein
MFVYDTTCTEENAISVTREQQDAYSRNGVIDLWYVKAAIPL